MSEQKKGNRAPMILLAVVVIGGVGFALEQFLAGRGHATTDDAYVTGNVVRVSPQINGTVTALNTAETQFVQKGQLLVQLDPRDTKIALAQAEANLAQAVRDVAQLFADERRDLAAVKAQQTLLGRAQQDAARDQSLVAVHGVSQESVQHEAYSVKSARDSLEQAQAALAVTQTAINGTTPETHPRILQAEANLRAAWLAAARTRIVAPISGYVVSRAVQLGEQVAPSTEMLAIVPMESVWIDANFKENQLGPIRIGQAVTVTADIYGSPVVFHGKVQGLSSGTGSALAVLPPQNASGNWIKIVQRLAVRVGLDPQELAQHPLLLGLSADVDVDTHDQSGVALSKQPAWDPASKTDVYQPQDDGVDAEIQKIVSGDLGKAKADGGAL